jgi:dihydroorotate dehydrogenase electron transfer subunit
MTQELCSVAAVKNIGSGIFVLRFIAPEIASAVQPGQFVNMKTNELLFPFLRRPFSVYRVDGESVEIIFNVVGSGTKILSEKQQGEIIDVIGPLGCSFGVDGAFETAILVGGGLGVAPLPVLTNALIARKRNLLTFLGARTSHQIVSQYLQNVSVATDDGSGGFMGTVVDLLRKYLGDVKVAKPKIFGCGPNPMLKSLSLLAHELQIPCEVSLESVMACGVGICQGCPVERTEGEKKYSLICKEGTVFDSESIRIV